MVFAISGTLLVAFSVLVRAEAARGKRILLSGLRERLDRAVLRTAPFLRATRRHLGTGSVRVIFHYVAHGVIARLVRMSERASAYLARLERRNRKLARTIRERETPSHFSVIAEHKATVALSDEEREDLKRRSLEGDL
jgi:hypothetical protein